MTRRQRFDDLTTFAVPEQPALSPDGSQIGYVLRGSHVAADRSVRSLWRIGVRTAEPEQLTRGQADTAPASAPDGTRIAFLRGLGAVGGGAHAGDEHVLIAELPRRAALLVAVIAAPTGSAQSGLADLVGVPGARQP